MDTQARRWIAVLAIVGVGALALAPMALAQSSGVGYGGQSGIAGQTGQGGSGGVAGQTGNSGVAGATSGAAGNPNAASQAGAGNRVLAFTGLDVALLAGGGLLLVMTGFGLRRLVTQPQR